MADDDERDDRDPAQAPGPGLPLPPRAAVRLRGAARHAATARDRGGDRALPDDPTRAERRVRLERNRFYRPWSALARPDGYPDVIDVRLGVKAREGIQAVRTGRRDRGDHGYDLAELAKLRRRDPGLIRDSVAADDDVALPQHPRAAVRRRRRAPRREPRDRPPCRHRGGGRQRRPPGHVSHRPAWPSRLPAGLPARPGRTSRRRAGWSRAPAHAAHGSRSGAGRNSTRRPRR